MKDSWVHRFHAGDVSVSGTGRFEVRRGTSILARLVGALLRLPSSGGDVPVRVSVRRSGEDELWTRTFGRRTLVSRQTREDDVRLERFGPLELRLRLHDEGDHLRILQTGTELRLGPARITIPPWLAPRVHAHAKADGEDRFLIRVDMSLPVAGPLLSYWGEVIED